MAREKRVAYGEIKRGVKHLEKSIGEIQRGLLKAEKTIEADARVRIRGLRKEARAQVGALKSKRGEAARALGKLSAAAGGTWEEVKRSADAILADGRAHAAALIERIRKGLTI
jgi:ribosomal 50S subunit-recycling heat shock protein